MNDRWANYYNATSSKPPSRLLMRALEYVRKGNNTLTALDLGAGALVDSKFLLDQGFIVTAVDNSAASENLAKKIIIPILHLLKRRLINLFLSRKNMISLLHNGHYLLMIRKHLMPCL